MISLAIVVLDIATREEDEYANFNTGIMVGIAAADMWLLTIFKHFVLGC